MFLIALYIYTYRQNAMWRPDRRKDFLKKNSHNDNCVNLTKYYKKTVTNYCDDCLNNGK